MPIEIAKKSRTPANVITKDQKECIVMKKVEKKSILIWSLEDIQSFLLCILPIALIYYFFNEYLLLKKIVILLCFYYSAKCLLNLIKNPLHYRNFNFNITRDTIYIQKGGFTVTHDTIPIRRIQHVDIEQTFFSRFFDLYWLNVYTAGLDHSIGFLKEGEAKKLKTDIVNLLIGEGIEQDEQEKRSLY